MSADEKRAVLWCLTSEINAFETELVKRGGPRKDYYGNQLFDVIVAHLKLLESARREIERIKVTSHAV